MFVVVLESVQCKSSREAIKALEESVRLLASTCQGVLFAHVFVCVCFCFCFVVFVCVCLWLCLFVLLLTCCSCVLLVCVFVNVLFAL